MTETYQGKRSVFDVKGLLRWLLWSPISFLGCLRSPFPFLSSAAITQLWHLRHLRVSITIEAMLFTASCRDPCHTPVVSGFPEDDSTTSLLDSCQVLFQTWAGTWPPLDLHTLWFFDVFLC